MRIETTPDIDTLCRQSLRFKLDSSGSASGSGDLEFYQKIFGIKDESVLSSKYILDIGASMGSFADTAMDRHGAKVFRLDPAYSQPAKFFATYSSDVKVSKANLIAGLGQKLPFRDEQFDFVFASRSIWWIKSGLNDTLSETFRVSKKKAIIGIYPAVLRPEVDDLNAETAKYVYENGSATYKTLLIRGYSGSTEAAKIMQSIKKNFILQLSEYDK